MVVTLILSVLTAVPRPPLSRVLKYWKAINLLLFVLSTATTYMLKNEERYSITFVNYQQEYP